MIFIDNYANPAAAAILEAAHHPAPAIDLHVLPPAQHFRGQHDGEIDERPDRDVAVHRKQHAVGRNVVAFPAS